MRIAIMGKPGGGKTTLAKKLQKQLNFPLHHIDKIQWLPGWKFRDLQGYVKIHDELILQESWIIDGGGPLEQLWERLDAADVIIFVNLSIWQHYWWTIRRQFETLFTPRADLPENCPSWSMTFKILKHIWYLHNEVTPKVLEKLKNLKQEQPDKNIFHVQSLSMLHTLSHSINDVLTHPLGNQEKIIHPHQTNDEQQEMVALLDTPVSNPLTTIMQDWRNPFSYTYSQLHQRISPINSNREVSNDMDIKDDSKIELKSYKIS